MVPRAFSRMNTGCSSRQATHQEANTLTSDTSPFRSPVARPSVRPLTGDRLKSGTGLQISVDGRAPRSLLRPIRNANPKPKKIAAGTKRTRRSQLRRAEINEQAASAAAPAGMSGAAIALYRRVDLRGASPDLVDRQSVRLVSGHAGHAGRHARQIDAGDLRLLREQAVDHLHRDVTAHDIAADQRYVARILTIRDAVLLAHRRQIFCRYDLYAEPLLAEV